MWARRAVGPLSDRGRQVTPWNTGHAIRIHMTVDGAKAKGW